MSLAAVGWRLHSLLPLVRLCWISYIDSISISLDPIGYVGIETTLLLFLLLLFGSEEQRTRESLMCSLGCQGNHLILPTAAVAVAPTHYTPCVWFFNNPQPLPPLPDQTRPTTSNSITNRLKRRGGQAGMKGRYICSAVVQQRCII